MKRIIALVSALLLLTALCLPLCVNATYLVEEEEYLKSRTASGNAATRYDEEADADGGAAFVKEDVSSTVSDEPAAKEVTEKTGMFSIADLFKKWIWLPIALVVLCLAILIGFRRTYNRKYRAIDPSAKKKKNTKTKTGSSHSETGRSLPRE